MVWSVCAHVSTLHVHVGVGMGDCVFCGNMHTYCDWLDGDAAVPCASTIYAVLLIFLQSACQEHVRMSMCLCISMHSQ